VGLLLGATIISCSALCYQASVKKLEEAIFRYFARAATSTVVGRYVLTDGEDRDLAAKDRRNMGVNCPLLFADEGQDETEIMMK